MGLEKLSRMGDVSEGVRASGDLPDDPTELMRATDFGDLTDITRKMVDSGNESYIPVLLEFMRIDRNPEGRFAWASSINRLVEGPDADQTLPERTDWGWWIEWLGRNPQVVAPEGYAGWKGELFSLSEDINSGSERTLLQGSQ